MNPYQVLGVSQNATKEEIKEAYHKLAKQFHPDINKNADAEGRFKEAAAAYELIKEGKTPRNATFHDVFGDPNVWWHARNQRVNDDFTVACELTLEEVCTGKVFNIHIAQDNRDVQVTIPAGIMDGSTLCMQGDGSRRFQDVKFGNLFVSVRVKRHPVFQRNGFHLGMNCGVRLLDSLLGTTIQVKTISGVTIDVEVPPLTVHGAKLKVQGHGLPFGSAETDKGDLYLIVSCVLPKELTPEQVTLLTEAREIENAKKMNT